MALVKQVHAQGMAKDAIVLDLGDLRRHGEEIVAQARAQAQRTIAEAHAERARLMEGADAKGFEVGFQRGFDDGLIAGVRQGQTQAAQERRAELAPLVEGWTRALEHFELERERMLSLAQRDVIRLAVQIAQRVCKRSVELDPGIVRGQMAEVLGLVMTPTKVHLAINPADRVVASDALPELVARLHAARDVTLVDDPSIARGSCEARLAESGARIDGSIRTQLDRIVEALLPADGAEGAS
jgi:flagellar biosynthesis/type III secretory pathway protein FliH